MLPQLGGVSFANLRHHGKEAVLAVVRGAHFCSEFTFIHKQELLHPFGSVVFWLQMKLEPPPGWSPGFRGLIQMFLRASRIFFSFRAHPIPGSLYQSHFKSVSVYIESGIEPNFLDSCINKRQAKFHY